MHAKDVIFSNLDGSDLIIAMYLDGLEDADLLVRPVPGMNHIAWQLGHLIASERRFVEGIQPGSCPPLPEGFEEAHNKESAASDDPKRFRTKAEYQALWHAQREATKQVLATLSDEQLDAPSQNMPPFVPTVGSVFNLAGTHALMHCGQFVGVRRLRNKPVAI